jgi:hypothetical protein
MCVSHFAGRYTISDVYMVWTDPAYRTSSFLSAYSSSLVLPRLADVEVGPTSLVLPIGNSPKKRKPGGQKKAPKRFRSAGE